jgi:hypothetical protein
MRSRDALFPIGSARRDLSPSPRKNLLADQYWAFMPILRGTGRLAKSGHFTTLHLLFARQAKGKRILIFTGSGLHIFLFS